MIWDPDCKGPCDCPGEELPSHGRAKTEEAAQADLAALLRAMQWWPARDEFGTNY